MLRSVLYSVRSTCSVSITSRVIGVSIRRMFSIDNSDASSSFTFDPVVFERACSSTVSAIEKMDGLATQPFSTEVRNKLMAPITPEDVEIRPDGTLYLPEIKYRRILNSAVGPGGWVIVPRGPPSLLKDMIFREFALYCYGKFTAQAIGEQQLTERGMTPVTAIEAAKSNALMRCCKDLGVASELWDPDFIKDWKRRYAVQLWAEHVTSGRKQKLWRKNGPGRELGYPWKESGLVTESSSSSDFSGGQYSTSSAASAPSSTSTFSSTSSATATLSFDPTSTVPPSLKKIAGKTWADIFTEEKDIEYLRWVVSHFSNGHAKSIAQAALAWWETGSGATTTH